MKTIEQQVEELRKAGLGGLALTHVRLALQERDRIAKEEEREKIHETASQIGECLEYCAVQNGHPECKNCGLTLKMYQALTTPLQTNTPTGGKN